MHTLTRLLIGTAVATGLVFGLGHGYRPTPPSPTAQPAPGTGAALASGPATASGTVTAHEAALAAELRRAVANGHATAAGADRFLAEVRRMAR